MQLYFLPLACSMATRIALDEAGAPAEYIEVDAGTKRLPDGRAFKEVHPLGLVPTLRTDDGELISENAAVLQYVARRFPEARLGAGDEREEARLQQWLCFIGTELHKALFVPLLDHKAPEAVKTYALEKGRSRLDYLEQALSGREFVLDRFTIIDAYLAAVLNWSMVTPVQLSKWPAIQSYLGKLRDRPSVARAVAEEMALYMAERSRRPSSR
jgi:glutathione S-transferase